MIKSLTVAIGLAVALAAVPAQAGQKTKMKTVSGCVASSSNQYHLAATTKKGKHKEYVLAGNQDFRAEVGHKVQAKGTVSGRTLKVSLMKDLSSSCR